MTIYHLNIFKWYNYPETSIKGIMVNSHYHANKFIFSKKYIKANYETIRLIHYNITKYCRWINILYDYFTLKQIIYGHLHLKIFIGQNYLKSSIKGILV